MMVVMSNSCVITGEGWNYGIRLGHWGSPDQIAGIVNVARLLDIQPLSTPPDNLAGDSRVLWEVNAAMGLLAVCLAVDGDACVVVNGSDSLLDNGTYVVNEEWAVVSHDRDVDAGPWSLSEACRRVNDALPGERRLPDAVLVSPDLSHRVRREDFVPGRYVVRDVDYQSSSWKLVDRSVYCRSERDFSYYGMWRVDGEEV